MQQNNIPVAIDAFTRAIDADASDIEIRNNLGYAYIQTKDFMAVVRLHLQELLQHKYL